MSLNCTLKNGEDSKSYIMYITPKTECKKMQAMWDSDSAKMPDVFSEPMLGRSVKAPKPEVTMVEVKQIILVFVFWQD